ncbi:hypothetical protein HCG46_15150 [Labrenzia sp. PO1]|uniref:hypothetical protein n=1 Tax=Labrenzia sp. PO1 TaxID=2720390 RepID=UPI001445001B|nr:hypothetical protein [Labrenzia sp. PO1]NKI59609.1 hypothetical protein [Labrenzia sp. PO1]
MKYSFETLDVAQKHSIVQSALRSMTHIRTGRRIPATWELELGFPFYKNSLGEDLISYCKHLYETDPVFDLDTDLLSNAPSGNDELIKICKDYLDSASSTNFALSSNFEDFKRRLYVYSSRHENGSELAVDGFACVMDSLHLLSRVFSKVIEGCNKTDAAEIACSFGENKQFLERCLVEAEDSFSSAAYEVFLIEDALDSQDAEMKQLALCRLGARRGITPEWPEKPLHGGSVHDIPTSENAS